MHWEPALVPNWRDAKAYEALLSVDRCTFAWEWLRRDPGYRTAAASHRDAPAKAGGVSSALWGLHAFEPPHRAAPRARPVWTQGVHPLVLSAQAVANAGTADFDLSSFGQSVTVLVDRRGCEHLLIGDGHHTIRLDITRGTVRDGPTRLRFVLDAATGIDGPLLTLRRFLFFERTRRFSRELHAPEPRARRLQMLLRTADALAQGANHRGIAEVLVAAKHMPAGWRDDAESVRMQVRRLVRGAEQMAAGGYRDLLR